MLFNSYEFIFLFLPIVFFMYFYLIHIRLVTAAKAFLVLASLFFYSWWNVIYLPLILCSMLFNYVIGTSLTKDSEQKVVNKKQLLTIGIVGNLSLLGYFKYTDFFISNFNFFSDTNLELFHLTLPLAISFFTFQQIAYLVDSYRGETKEYDFLNYAVFVTFFPQLIAGPIVHHKEMMPQFANKWNLVKNYKNIALGLFIFAVGLFKKVVIADTLAEWATNGFDNAYTLNLLEAWVTSLSYTFQLYFDFSGYADMAIGLALLFNIKLPINFNSPYKATNIQDFWRRWHITLSRFLRDYIYIPLGGNKKGEFRTYTNLLVTFFLGGLWHGAAWTFVFWGLLHGMALVIHRMWQKLNFKLNSIIAWFITFNFINISWVFFRAKEWDDAMKVLKGMFNFNDIHFVSYKMKDILSNINGDEKTIGMIVWSFLIVFFLKNSSFYLRSGFSKSYKTLFIIAVLYVISLIEMHKVSEFLYFNF
ncbi:MBOAT family O-acyltransferase [Arcobacter sp. FWKO B]|uniref:MBOAT family O-acyltransferase n=1 Tax=Arcobacter sp. FWKO B TaxID=2593672 RepID=UPI0018A5CB05|nr:MBOAT family protein [Arcobacter sp. FWKO B]QOG11497.1 MBOAT family protein [Arcobacter sp. FWKO B]